jgi:thiamine kinase-like enzyme
MNTPKNIANFLNRNGWHLVEQIDLGTTADIFIVEKDHQRQALKIRRDGATDSGTLRVEHQVLQYLNTTAMQQYVPGVGEWLEELDGFLMAYLRYPTQAEREATTWIPGLARALQALHSVSPPTIEGIGDDCPEIGKAISNRFLNMFHVVKKENSFWIGLPREDQSNLETVRAHHESCCGLLQQIEELLIDTRPALTHGDLAGDNIMLTPDGRLAIADWGTARISSALADVAHLLTYAGWSRDEERQFLSTYFGDDPSTLGDAMPCIQVLTRLYRYHSCVQSLLWLNEREGLDAVGKAHFERLLSAL